MALLEERVARLEAENDLLRARFLRVPDLVHELAHRLKAEWPRWGTRRIAGQLTRLGVKASRTSVQRILRRGPKKPTEPEEVVTGSRGRVLLAKRPDHIWLIDFTRVGGIVRPLWIGAVTAGTLSVRFLDGDQRLSILRLRSAA